MAPPLARSVFLLVGGGLSTGHVFAAGGLDIPWGAVTVAFSPDSQWLYAAVLEAAGGRVLAYDAHMRGPFEASPLLLAGAASVPLAVLPGS